MSDYLKKPEHKEHEEDFRMIRKRIMEALKDYKNFNGVDFVDVNAGGIQINGRHKKTGHYYYILSTIRYDFSNVDEAIDEFVNAWKEYDTPKRIRDFTDFIETCQKYGWD